MGSAVAFWFAAPGFETGVIGQGVMAAIGVGIAQIVVAGLLAFRVQASWILALAVLVIQLVALTGFWLFYLVFSVLPMAGGGPLPGNEFRPMALFVLVTATIGIILIYAAAIRQVLAMRAQ